MAPLRQARETRLLETGGDSARFAAKIDLDWSVFRKPHGGYLLAVILDATSRFQQHSKPHHPDPAHLVCHFITGTDEGEATVDIKRVRTGKSWTNLYVELKQKENVRITCQLLYTRMPDIPTDDPQKPFSDSHQYLLPSTPSAFAKQSPFLTHPAQCQVGQGVRDDDGRRWSKNSAFCFMPEHVQWAEDLAIKQRRLDSSDRKDRDLEWAAWLEFKKSDTVDQGSIGMSSIPELFPEGERIEPHYFPTLAMSVHFHARLPLTGPYLSAPQTIGCYSKGSGIISQGRHEQLVEVWTAPGPIGTGEVQEDWRRKCIPLATSTQLALCVPASKLKAAAASGQPKL
ncbi:hypothetical protein OIV83_004900 [Microbotryomycetes sp. JL201]|nr:hypothetical protein OIV83_004900 [Microbotryomycetes sp. JL201]